MMFWCCLLFGIFLTCRVKYIQCQETFPELLHATKRLLDYYRGNYKDLNLDGLFGLRLLEGQAQEILQNSDRLDIEVKTFIQNVLEESRNISDLSLPYVQQDDEEYFAKLAPLVKAPILKTTPYRRINPRLLWDKDETHPALEFNEEKSDDCFTELLKVAKAPTCEISKSCLEMMTEKGLREYGVTHQLLYTMVIEQGGCRQAMDSYLVTKGFSSGISEFQQNLCTNIFFEVSELVQKFHGEVRPILQDLFLEQEFVCAMLGFMEFLHVDWLRQIIAWQKPSGCYGKMPRVSRLENLPSEMDYEYVQTADTSMDRGVDRPQQVEDNSDQRLHDQEYHADILNQNQLNPQNGVYNNLNQAYNYNFGNANEQGGGDMMMEQPQQPLQVPAQQQQQQPLFVPAQQQQQQPLFVPAQQQQQQQQQEVQFMPQINQQGNNAANNNLNQPWNGNGAQPPQNVEYNARGGENSDNEYYNQQGNQDAVIQQNVGNRNLLFVHTETKNKSSYLNEIQRVSNPELKSMEHLGVRRKLLVEKSMLGDCLAHKTGVAVGAISQYLRYYLEPGPPEFNLAVQINGINYLLQPASKLLARGQGAADPTTSKVVAEEGPVERNEDNYRGNYRDSAYNVEEGGAPQLEAGGAGVANQQFVGAGPRHGDGLDDSHYDGDNEDKPQDYYNEDDDEEEQEEEDDGENDEEWKNVAPPPIGGLNDRQNVQGALDEEAMYINGGDAPGRYHDNNHDNGDQEYAQYIDNDKEDQPEDGVGADINPKHGPVLGKNGVPAQGDKYPYYYDRAGPGNAGIVSPAAGNRDPEPLEGPQVTPKPQIAHKVVVEKSDTGVSVGTSYAILLVVMLTLLYYMNKFVRRRRILIKYR